MFLLFLSVTAALELQCKFETDEPERSYYECVVDNPRVDSSRTVVTAVAGVHLEGRNNNDVCCFLVRRSPLLRAMPKGLEKFFPNLTMIRIETTRLSSIKQTDLKPLSELTILDLMYNKLRVLESGLFEFNTKLSEIYFGGNQLNAIAPDILDPLVNLENAFFGMNLCIDMEFGYGKISLDDLKKEIHSNCQNETKM